jgi:hypothetical protein
MTQTNKGDEMPKRNRGMNFYQIADRIFHVCFLIAMVCMVIVLLILVACMVAAVVFPTF